MNLQFQECLLQASEPFTREKQIFQININIKVNMRHLTFRPQDFPETLHTRRQI